MLDDRLYNVLGHRDVCRLHGYAKGFEARRRRSLEFVVKLWIFGPNRVQGAANISDNGLGRLAWEKAHIDQKRAIVTGIIRTADHVVPATTANDAPNVQ